MGEDVPLTAFDSGDETDDADSADGSVEETEPVEESADRDEPDAESSDSDKPVDEPAEIEPVETPSLTYTSSPDGAACAACGETVEKRWRAGEGGVSADENGEGGVDDPDALVCPGCKEW